MRFMAFLLVLGCQTALVDSEDTGTDTTDTGTTDVTPYTVPLTAVAFGTAAGPTLVSNGVPFAPGQLTNIGAIALFNGTNELPIAVQSLAVWPDGSVRSVLLQFEWDSDSLSDRFDLQIGHPRTTTDRIPVPVTWTVPQAVAFPSADWLAQSRVAGRQSPHGEQAWAVDWEQSSVSKFQDLRGDSEWGNDCRLDGYYSTTWSWYQLFARTADPDIFAEARREAVHYRDDQIVQTGPDAGTMNGRNEPRYLYQKALTTDYLLTGDPKTLQVAGQMANYVLDEWDADYFHFERTQSNFWTERRVGFAFLNLVVHGELTGDSKYLDALKPRFEGLLATQAEWPDGGFIHNLYAHDTEECPIEGTYGGSPFMTGLLFEGLIAYHELTGDERAVSAVAAAADWMWDDGWTGAGFQYQIGCETETGHATPDLDLMIVHGFAFAYHHTGEARFKTRGMEVFESGVENGYLGSRKHYNQQYRSSPSAVFYLSQ